PEWHPAANAENSPEAIANFHSRFPRKPDPELERVSRTLDPDRVPELNIPGSDEYLLGPRCSSLVVALLRMYLSAFLSGSPSLSPSLLSPSGTLPIGPDYDQYLSG
ncbi:hypothetical protein BGZ76_007854, partial [Entomortierella beljakovae]